MNNTSYPSASRLSGDELRLVKIRPGEWSEPIRCDLFCKSLSNAPPYNALSYVWGAKKTTRPILLDGQIFHATLNLESALRHLRQQPEQVKDFLWIDALCINQTDVAERTHQVSIMGSIYRSCQSVFVYLGDGIDHREQIKRARSKPHIPPSVVTFPRTKENLGQSLQVTFKTPGSQIR